MHEAFIVIKAENILVVYLQTSFCTSVDFCRSIVTLLLDNVIHLYRAYLLVPIKS